MRIYNQQLLDAVNRYHGNSNKKKITMAELKEMDYECFLQSAKMAGYVHKFTNVGKAYDKQRKVSACCNADVNKAMRRIGEMEYLCSKCKKHCEVKNN